MHLTVTLSGLRGPIRCSCYQCCWVQTVKGRRWQKRGTTPQQSSPPPSSGSCIWCCRASAWPPLCICSGTYTMRYIKHTDNTLACLSHTQRAFIWTRTSIQSKHILMHLQTLSPRRHVHAYFKVNLPALNSEPGQTNYRFTFKQTKAVTACFTASRTQNT